MTNDPQPSDNVRTEPPARYAAYPPGPPADELSLADLVCALGRRWRWIAVCVLLAVLAAAAFAAGRTPQYEYTATLRVGTLGMEAQPTVTVDDQRAGAISMDRMAIPIDKVANVVGTLERHYLPQAAHQIGQAVSVNAQRVDDSDLVELSAEAPAARADAVTTVMEKALEQVVADHRHALAGRLNQLEATTAEATDGSATAKREALQQAIDLLDAPMGDGVVTAHARAERILQAADPALRPTRVLAQPQRSDGAVGISAGVIVALALVLGLGAGVVLALLVDAVRREGAAR